MATDKYPQQNVNMPMKQSALDAARARLGPSRTVGPSPSAPADGKGSRREIRPGEWVDDRVIRIGGPSSPSKDSPPEPKPKSGKAVPSSFDPAKAYAVHLNKPVTFAGRMLTPGKNYEMAGYVCNDPAVKPAIYDAVELGALPVDPDSPPS